MRKLKESAYRINRFEKQDTVNELNPSVVVLKYIEPARELLESSNLMNSVYKKQLNYLPYIFKCCDQLHPLAQSRNDEQNFSYNPDMVVNIYRRDLSLKINPFETKNYFRSTGSEFRPKTKTQVQNHSSYNLSFDSHFESGNLLSVDKEVLNQRYHLMMQNDINTYGCTQWFFFRVLNKEPAKITMLINNFYKISSLYQKGMKVLIFSMKKYVNEGVGWIRGGDQISYFPNKITQKKLSNGNFKQFYTLKFSYYLEYDNDEVYFAYNYPYTYSKLNSYLTEKQISKNIYFNCRTLCKTAAQNKLFLLTITDNSVDKSKKNSIFVTSRVHPGQTVSSLIAQGIIDFLISDNPVAQALRQRFIFKIVPMLNPDGVIHGNYRTNLAGLDLNRVWDSADKFLSPQIYQIKKYIIEYNKQCPVMMFCDLHGHSARKSAFIYGCQREKLKLINVDEECRLFPFMLSCQNQDFLYKSCNFKMDKSKKGTARIQLWKQLRIPNIFTLQASFCSSQNSQYHFRPTDYSQIGVSFCKTIHQYFLNANKRKQFYQKLKLVKQNFSKKADSDQQTDSDNDLLDQKTINELKNGLAVETLWNKRKLIIERPPSIESQTQKKQKKVLPKRRITIDRSRKVAKTETSPQLNTAIITISSKKTITTSIPTKRLTLDTDVMKYAQPKGCLKGSIFQRVEHNYRGKSTIYRIQRKNVKNFCNLNNEVYKKSSSIFEMDNSLDLY